APPRGARPGIDAACRPCRCARFCRTCARRPPTAPRERHRRRRRPAKTIGSSRTLPPAIVARSSTRAHWAAAIISTASARRQPAAAALGFGDGRHGLRDRPLAKQIARHHLALDERTRRLALDWVTWRSLPRSPASPRVPTAACRG